MESLREKYFFLAKSNHLLKHLKLIDAKSPHDNIIKFSLCSIVVTISYSWMKFYFVVFDNKYCDILDVLLYPLVITVSSVIFIVQQQALESKLTLGRVIFEEKCRI
jgi:hypothetical protein